MVNETVKKIKLIYGIVVSLLLVASGISLIVSCVSIYKRGGSPFSRESVTEAFSHISALIYVLLILLVLGAVMMIIFPDDKKKLKGVRDLDVSYRKLEEKIDMTVSDARIKLLFASAKMRKALRVCAIAVCVACLALACCMTLLIILGSDIKNANETVTKCATVSLLIMTLALLIGFSCRILTDISLKRSIDTAKGIIAEREYLANGDVLAAKKERKQRAVRRGARALLYTKIAIVAVGAFLIIMGLCGDGAKGTFEKAIRICTECIGLG